MRFVHAADLHIDSPLRGLERYEGAPSGRIRGATREAFTRIVGLCLAEGARFLVLAGDVFDGEWKDFNTGLFFKRELLRLRETDCHVILVRGNHDAPSEVMRSLEHADHVHELDHRRPETKRFERENVAFHGMSYGKREVTTNLVPLYPSAVPGMLNVGVLHTNAGGNAAHASYAPCSLGDLLSKGYHYWALGHVHAHEVLHRDPWVVYPGNSQARHARETGAKGAMLVDVEGDRIVSAERRFSDVMRFVAVDVALGRDDDRAALLDKASAALAAAAASAGGLLAAVRLTVSGESAAHAETTRESKRQALIAEIRGRALDFGEGLWLEKIVFATRPAASIEALRGASDLVGDLLRQTAQLRVDPPELARIASVLGALQKKYARELEHAGVDLGDSATLARLLGEAEALLAQRLTEEGEV